MGTEDSMSEEEWLKLKKQTPVRIQWDPDRDEHLKAQISRAIQIGLSAKAVELYVNDMDPAHKRCHSTCS